jgi:hypothetical protein
VIVGGAVFLPVLISSDQKEYVKNVLFSGVILLIVVVISMVLLNLRDTVRLGEDAQTQGDPVSSSILCADTVDEAVSQILDTVHKHYKQRHTIELPPHTHYLFEAPFGRYEVSTFFGSDGDRVRVCEYNGECVTDNLGIFLSENPGSEPVLMEIANPTDSTIEVYVTY